MGLRVTSPYQKTNYFFSSFMFVVFDVTVDGQTEDVSVMSFSLLFPFSSERDMKTVTGNVRMLLPVSYEDISGVNYKN